MPSSRCWCRRPPLGAVRRPRCRAPERGDPQPPRPSRSRAATRSAGNRAPHGRTLRATRSAQPSESRGGSNGPCASRHSPALGRSQSGRPARRPRRRTRQVANDRDPLTPRDIDGLWAPPATSRSGRRSGRRRGGRGARPAATGHAPGVPATSRVTSSMRRSLTSLNCEGDTDGRDPGVHLRSEGQLGWKRCHWSGAARMRPSSSVAMAWVRRVMSSRRRPERRNGMGGRTTAWWPSPLK